MSQGITEETYKLIDQMISNPQNPADIDPKQTHVIIIHKLVEIEKRLHRMEAKIDFVNGQLAGHNQS